jgi:hypothetical protein
MKIFFLWKRDMKIFFKGLMKRNFLKIIITSFSCKIYLANNGKKVFVSMIPF